MLEGQFGFATRRLSPLAQLAAASLDYSRSALLANSNLTSWWLSSWYAFERRIAMPSAKLIVAVAAAILVAQVQCVAACAADACVSQTASVPPCHKHHDHSHDQTPASCSFNHIITPAMQPHASLLDLPAPSVLGLAATMSLVLPVDIQTWALDLLVPLPPGSPGISSAVLRI
jgi:hypothetical protein